MRVEVSDPDLVEDLIESLRSVGCDVVRAGPNRLDVRFGWPVLDAASGYELDGYLRVWEAMHPNISAARLD
ncbi:MAG TPA: hypothetical protein VH281_01350 [Gaiellaceae bacterium]